MATFTNAIYAKLSMQKPLLMLALLRGVVNAWTITVKTWIDICLTVFSNQSKGQSLCWYDGVVLVS